jgi:hypothetical protein
MLAATIHAGFKRRQGLAELSFRLPDSANRLITAALQALTVDEVDLACYRPAKFPN